MVPHPPGLPRLTRAAAVGRRSRGADRTAVCALGLVGVWVLWAVVTTVLQGRVISPLSPYVVAPVALVLGAFLGTRLAPHAADPRLHLALAGFGAVLVLGVLLVAEPGKAPLGYANANAALAVQVVAMCGLALLTGGRTRGLLVVAGALALAATALNRSAAAVVLAVPAVLAVGLALWLPPSRRWWPALLGALVSGATGAVFVHAVTRPVLPQWAAGLFDAVRQQLWRDAADLWQAHPLTGAGVGSFRDATPLSVDDDTASAHSSVLQVAAETGWVGLTLFGLIALSGFLWLARARVRADAALVAATAWAALLVQSYVDHLVEFAPVVLAAGVVLGWAAGTATSEQLDVPEGQRPVAR